MPKTIVADWFRQPRVGYWVGFLLSPTNQHVITKLLNELSAALPGVLWLTSPEQLHVTLFEIIMPLRDYPEDKDELFARRKEEIECNLAELFAGQRPIRVRFDVIAASDQSIIIKGSDDGSFQKLRDMAVKRPIILGGSRMPPDIIHTSIARFRKPVDLGVVQDVVGDHTVSFEEGVEAFSLRRIHRTPLEAELLKSYSLHA